ncbi:MAG: GNAT family N-acetyltransferase [Pseudomonadota bacterium]
MINHLMTGRYILRQPCADDAERIALLCNDYELSKFTSRIPHPYTLADADAFIACSRKAWENGEEQRFMICRDDEVIGAVGLMTEGVGVFELGIWIGAPDRGKGVASKVIPLIVEYAFSALNARCVEAGFFRDNPASGRVLAKSGFRKTGEIAPTHSAARNVTVDAIRMQISKPD